MPLIETLAIEVGSSIAKSVFKLWLKDHNIISDTSLSIVDMLKGRTMDRLAQRNAQRQFEEMGERVGQSLLPIFEMEGANLDENDRIAVGMAVAETLNTTTSKILAENNLEPLYLANYLLRTHPAETYHFNELETSLYQNIIIESCTYIIDIASQLPTFSEQTFAEVLKRETQILDKVNQVLQEVQRLSKQQNPKEEETRFELDYRRAVLRKLDMLELFGANVRGASREQSLSIAYVRLSVEKKMLEMSEQAERKAKISNVAVVDTIEDAAGRRITSLGRRDNEQRSIVLVDEVLAQSQYLLIRGLAGSGKSTLLQWIAVNGAAKSFQGTLKSWNALLPFYIRLRFHLGSDKSEQPNLPSIEEFPYLISHALPEAPKGWVREKLLSGRAIVLIDGVDEVPEAQRADVRLWLKDLIETYPQAHFVITSRPTAIGEDWIDWMAVEGFQDALLQHMSLPDISLFIDHWHKAVAKRLHDEQEKDELPNFAQHLKEELGKDRTKRELATNPLLCAMLCTLNLDRYQQLPSNRSNLYEACCELLIEQRDKARKISLKDYPAATLGYSQKLLLLQDLAYWMIRNNRSEMDSMQVDERFKRKLNSMRNLPQLLSGEDAGVYIRKFFIERTSILREPLISRIDFTHRTFQEFLAARAILDEDDIGVVARNAYDDQWREVVLLAFSMASKKTRQELIDRLIWQGDTNKTHRTRLHLLAASCIETSIEEVEPHVKQIVQERLSALVPPKNFTEAEELARAGDLAVPYLARDATSAPSVRAACIYTLACIGSSEALTTLKSYSADFIETEELARAGDLVVPYLARDGASEPSVRAVCVATLACIGSSEALTTLKGYIYDTSEEVINELWQIWNSLEREKRDTYAYHILSHMRNCPQELSIANFTSLQDFQYFKELTNLSLSDCQQINNMLPLYRLVQLTKLELRNCPKIDNLAPLSGLVHLSDLSLSDFQQITDLSPLSELFRLIKLELKNCPKIFSLEPLSGLVHLSHLSLSGCQQINNLSPLSRLSQLIILDLRDCSKISTLGPLLGLKKLHVAVSPSDALHITIPQSMKKRTHITDNPIWWHELLEDVRHNPT